MASLLFLHIMSAELFVPLDEVTPQVVDDFIPLLSQLSSSFDKKDMDEKRFTAERNLIGALTNDDFTFVMVHRDEETGSIVSTATGNIVRRKGEGWVDDVVTLESHRGRRLGWLSMEALHNRFMQAGIDIVRLTSSHDRETAGKLYAKMGYREKGMVFRASLTGEPITETLRPTDVFEPVNCPIPTGNKAWLYGPRYSSHSKQTLVHGLRAASSILQGYGIDSANYYSEGQPQYNYANALKDAGFVAHDTRLYTIDLAT